MPTKKRATKLKGDYQGLAARIVAIMPNRITPPRIADEITKVLSKLSPEDELAHAINAAGRRAVTKTKKGVPALRKQLSEDISAVITHPNCPAELRHEILSHITDEQSHLLAELEVQPWFIYRVLERGGCGYICCPGSATGVCASPQGKSGRHRTRR